MTIWKDEIHRIVSEGGQSLQYSSWPVISKIHGNIPMDACQDISKSDDKKTILFLLACTSNEVRLDL